MEGFQGGRRGAFAHRLRFRGWAFRSWAFRGRAALVGVAIALALAAVTSKPAAAQGLTADQIISPYFIAMLAGPINDGASVILVKKRPNFISIETPIIGCISGFGAGALAAAAPALAMTVASGGVLAPLSAGYVANHGLFGCIVSGVGGIVGIATAAAMELYDGKPHSPYIEIIGP